MTEILFSSCTKVPSDAVVRQVDNKDSAQVDTSLNEAKPQQDTQEKSLVKRDLSHDLANEHDKLEESDKAVEIARNDDAALQTAKNQTNSQHKEFDGPANKDISESVQHSLDKRTFHGISNKTVAEESHKVDVRESIKIRDLKSNKKLKGKRSSSLSSKSFRTFLSKQSSRRSRRSTLQVRNSQ